VQAKDSINLASSFIAQELFSLQLQLLGLLFDCRILG